MKRIVAFLSLALVLSACSTERSVTESGSVISTRSTTEGGVSLKDQMVTADVVHHTFSDGNQMTFYRLGNTFFAEGSDIGYAPARELATTISRLEVNHAKQLTGQQAGMQPGQQVNGVPVVWPSGVDRGLLYYDVGGFPGNA